jgi:EAL domain-containing protein (putative c-di-GMP-specific phosphodiesterase class I)
VEKDDGYISPGEFIPLAEATGLIIELGRFALEKALEDQKRFLGDFAKAFPDLAAPFMSVNVSGLQLADMDEIDLLAGIINKSGADPATVKLEITETLMMEDPDHAADALNKLKALGVMIAIDDFGTGYSSLSYLHQFPLDTLKIDRAFVINMNKSKSSNRIVRSIANLALSLEMDIVAEGIEEKTQMDDLRGLGCQYGQGYIMAKPMPADDIIELMESRPNW